MTTASMRHDGEVAGILNDFHAKFEQTGDKAPPYIAECSHSSEDLLAARVELLRKACLEAEEMLKLMTEQQPDESFPIVEATADSLRHALSIMEGIHD